MKFQLRSLLVQDAAVVSQKSHGPIISSGSTKSFRFSLCCSFCARSDSRPMRSNVTRLVGPQTQWRANTTSPRWSKFSGCKWPELNGLLLIFLFRSTAGNDHHGGCGKPGSSSYYRAKGSIAFWPPMPTPRLDWSRFATTSSDQTDVQQLFGENRSSEPSIPSPFRHLRPAHAREGRYLLTGGVVDFAFLRRLAGESSLGSRERESLIIVIVDMT